MFPIVLCHVTIDPRADDWRSNRRCDRTRGRYPLSTSAPDGQLCDNVLADLQRLALVPELHPPSFFCQNSARAACVARDPNLMGPLTIAVIMVERKTH